MPSRSALGSTIEDEFNVGTTRFIKRPVKDIQGNLSSIEGVSQGQPVSKAAPTQEPIEISATKNTSKNKKGGSNIAPAARASAAVLTTGLDILNANFQFDQIEGKARTNIMLAEFQKNETLRIGKESALREETKGFARGEAAVLSAIGQGQEASGGIARSGQLAEETFGIYNSIMVETNAIREAYGFEAQQAFLESEINLAEINRDAAVATSLISGAASVATSGVF